MKKYILTALIISLFQVNKGIAQTRGIKIGYIDMEYILEKVPDYAEAKNQLEQKRKNGNKKLRPKRMILPN